MHMADLRFSVLGPLQVRRGDTALAVGYPQQQAMLAALLLRAGRSAGGAELTEALWGAEPPVRAMSTVRTYAWRWRKVLGADGTPVTTGRSPFVGETLLG